MGVMQEPAEQTIELPKQSFAYLKSSLVETASTCNYQLDPTAEILCTFLTNYHL